jgi:hypothetical protein
MLTQPNDFHKSFRAQFGTAALSSTGELRQVIPTGHYSVVVRSDEKVKVAVVFEPVMRVRPVCFEVLGKERVQVGEICSTWYHNEGVARIINFDVWDGRERCRGHPPCQNSCRQPEKYWQVLAGVGTAQMPLPQTTYTQSHRPLRVNLSPLIHARRPSLIKIPGRVITRYPEPFNGRSNKYRSDSTIFSLGGNIFV